MASKATSITTSGFYPVVVSELWHWTGDRELVGQLLGPALKAMRGRDNFRLVDVPWGGHCANLDAPDEIRGG